MLLCLCADMCVCVYILCIRVVYHVLIGTYCPVVSGKVIPAITVKDREGIWRLGSCKFHAIHEDVLSDELIEQPELQNYFLTELYSAIN